MAPPPCVNDSLQLSHQASVMKPRLCDPDQQVVTLKSVIRTQTFQVHGFFFFLKLLANH